MSETRDADLINRKRALELGGAIAAGVVTGGAVSAKGASAADRPQSPAYQPPIDYQTDWRFCAKCYGLFWHGGATNGVCPAGGEHDKGGSWNFELPVYAYS